MIQVFSLPNLDVKDHKNEKQWFLYKNNGIALRQSHNADMVSIGWEVIKSSTSDSSQQSSGYAVFESQSPTESPTENSLESGDSSTQSGISSVGKLIQKRRLLSNIRNGGIQIPRLNPSTQTSRRIYSCAFKIDLL